MRSVLRDHRRRRRRRRRRNRSMRVRGRRRKRPVRVRVEMRMGRRRRRRVVVIAMGMRVRMSVHALSHIPSSIATLLGVDEPLDHEGGLAESCNLLLHGDTVLAVGSAMSKHSLLFLVVLSSPSAHNALNSASDTCRAAAVAGTVLTVRSANGSADGTSRLGGQMSDTAVDVGETDNRKKGKGDSGHTKSHQNGVRARRSMVVTVMARRARGSMVVKGVVRVLVPRLHRREPVVAMLSVVGTMGRRRRRRGRREITMGRRGEVAMGRRRGQIAVRRRRRKLAILRRGRELAIRRRRRMLTMGRRRRRAMARRAERWSSMGWGEWVRVVSRELVRLVVVVTVVRAHSVPAVAIIEESAVNVSGGVLDSLGDGVDNALEAVTVPEFREAGRRGRWSAVVGTSFAEALVDGHFLFVDLDHKIMGLGVKCLELLDLGQKLFVHLGLLMVVALALTLAFTLALGLFSAMEVEYKSGSSLAESQEKLR